MSNRAPLFTDLRMNELQQQNIRAAIPQYYEYINNRIIVEFKPKDDEDTTLESYSIELSKKSTYDQVRMPFECFYLSAIFSELTVTYFIILGNDNRLPLNSPRS